MSRLSTENIQIILESFREYRTRSVNQYLTHWIYPYKGKFHPQMIRALLNTIGLVEFTIDYCKKIGFDFVKNIDKIIFGLY